MTRRRQTGAAGGSDIASMARAIASDDPQDFDRMSPAMKEYWERIAGRVFVHLHRLARAKAEMDSYQAAEAEAA